MSEDKSRTGQVSLVDLFLLVFFMALILVVSVYAGHQSVTSGITRGESAYAQSMITTLMEYRPDSFGTYPNYANLTVADAIDMYFCRDMMPFSGLNATINRFLDKTVKPDYNYIFFSFYNKTGTEKALWSWNRQSTVCAQYIPIKTFRLKLTCSPDQYTEPILGIWPKWKELPEGCELSA